MKEIKEERTSLGYLPNAPLPTFLRKEDMVKNVTITQEERDKDLTGALDSLADLLNSEAVLSNGVKLTAQQFKDGRGIPTIEESIFVKSWLPHFYHDNAQSELSITNGWITQISGNAYTPVDVMREGIVIFRVPPALGSMNIISSRDRLKPVGILYKELEDVVVRSPLAIEAQARHFCNSIFIPRDANTHQSELIANRNLKYIYIMDEIFQYYGYDTILTPELMSIKKQVMGPDYNEYYTSGAIPQSKPISAGQQSATIENDDDLFDFDG